MKIVAPSSASAPLLQRQDYGDASAFRPENMLREARRQKHLQSGQVPSVCILDPDGDIVDYVRSQAGATRSNVWACYHTTLWEFESGGCRYGVIGHAVGASFAVLVAEQAFVSGCELLIAISSAGQIHRLGPPPYHILIDKALRDEGTSYHYLPPSMWSEADPAIVDVAQAAFARSDVHVHRGSTWTTDAPFRETEAIIASRAETGVCAVEMEASALYAFARSTGHAVLCLAHVTNQLGRVENDFEKGTGNGARASLDLIESFAQAWLKAGRVPLSRRTQDVLALGAG
jgi:uridine phosphorylase